MHIEVNRDLDKFKDINYITSNHEEREDIIEECHVLLKQSNSDSVRFSETSGVSDAQLEFVKNFQSGTGLIKS